MHGPQAALDAVDRVAEALAGYHLLHATRGEMLLRLGRPAGAEAAFAAAHDLATNDAERRFLAGRRATASERSGG